MAEISDRCANAGRDGRRTGRELRQPPAPAADPRQPALEVLRDKRHDTEDHEHPGRQRGGDERACDRSLPIENAGAEQHAEQHQRAEIDRVQKRQERNHPARGPPALHPSLAKRPVRQGHASGAPRREENRRAEPRHRDLVRGSKIEPPADCVLVVATSKDPPKEHRVGEEPCRVEPERDDDPIPGRVAELVDRVADPDDLREDDVDRDNHQNDGEDQADQPAAVPQQRRTALLEVLGVLLEVRRRH